MLDNVNKISYMKCVDYIKKEIEKYNYGDPIYISQLTEQFSRDFMIDSEQAQKKISVIFARLRKNENLKLRFYRKGIYYKTKDTVFGEIGIKKSILIENKYLINNSGYISGLSFLNMIGLSTQIPAKFSITSNRIKNSVRYDDTLDVYVYSPKITINSENIKYLQLLDCISILEKSPVDVENPHKIIMDYVVLNDLDFKKMLGYAYLCYGQNVVNTLAKIATMSINS